MGVACSSWEEYQLGACWGCDHAHCAVMGFHAHPHHQEARGVNVNKENVNNTDPDNTDYPDNQGVHIDSPGVPLTFQNISRVQNGSKDAAADGHPSDEVKSPSIKVFLGTNSEEPFCAEQYKISMVTSLTEASVKSGGDLARFTVGLRGQHGQHTVPPPERPTFVEAGGRVSWLGFSHPLGTLHALHVEYEKDHGFLHALIFRFSEPTLYVESFEVEQLSTGLVDRFPFCAGQMSAGGSYTLFPDAPCPILHLPKSTP
ncbi:uncharacterized protein LOC121859679 [Homarus americanus]|uniref:uncharacterized protein LOC121859679 n=1 Tax=Homarus americanus TaxID=6706 RepID=UPI001C44A9A2|nr:uncharacterized protein LOC121859679 [Homarus americanus]